MLRYNGIRDDLVQALRRSINSGRVSKNPVIDRMGGQAGSKAEHNIVGLK